MILDDAGKRVPLVRCNLTYLPLASGPLPLDVQRAMCSAAMSECGKLSDLFSRQGLFRRAWVFLLSPVFAISSVRLTTYFQAQGQSNVHVWPIALVVILLVFYFGWKGSSLMLTDRVRAICAQVAVVAGYCASCGYSLIEPSDVEAQTCCCSECGAVWHRTAPQQR